VAAPSLILASASPQRQSLLREAGYAFAIEPAEIDEERIPRGMLPSHAAVHLAVEKARVIASRHPEAVVLGADTIVAFGDTILGKPRTPEAAADMLRLLSGTTHLVITGVAIMHKASGYDVQAREISAVRMKFLTARQIDEYVAGDQWRGKAGGYGIQHDDPFVTRLAGSRSNIIGLPKRLTRDLLAGVKIVPTNPPSASADEH
jgi:septum formation protein